MIHGRPSTYTVYKCRCVECRKAWRDYYDIYRSKKRELSKCLECSDDALLKRRRCAKHLKKVRERQHKFLMKTDVRYQLRNLKENDDHQRRIGLTEGSQAASRGVNTAP